jgi:predicted DNA-binding transcriptional regulator AlpA
MDNVDYVRSRKQTAARLNISLKTLQRMEKRGEAPPRVRITDRTCGYRDSAIEQFLKSREIT